MSSINPKKLKVTELKRELESRNIHITKGLKKADLVAMLLSALESEIGQEKEFSSSENQDDSVIETDSQEEQDDDACLGETSGTIPATEQQEEPDTNLLEVEKEQEKPTDQDEKAAEEQQNESNKETSVQMEEEVGKAEQESKPPPKVEPEMPPAVDQATIKETEKTLDVPTEVPPAAPLEDAVVKSEAETMVEEAKTEDETQTVSEEEKTVTEGEPAATEQQQHDVEMPEEQTKVNGDAAEEKSKSQTKDETNDKTKSVKPDSKQDSDQYRKRRHDDKGDRQSRWEDRYAPPEEEPEEDFDDTLVALDVYNSDLNFKISRERHGGQPLTMEGFAFLWGGARATYGVKTGKVCFECKLLEEDAVKHLPSDEPHPRVVRVGWSTDKSSLQLGEEELSYGYGGTGKSSVGCKFEDYGETFQSGDVIGCYVDFSAEGKFSIAYTKNGKHMGVAFTEEKTRLGEEVLFPHVLCKNTSVELNFGQKETPHFPHPEELSDYVFISSVPTEEKVRATKGPESRKDCEVLMMCGLPGAGKTFYAAEKVKENPEKKYNILGTNEIMEKMRVMGVARKKNYAGRWDALMQNATHCLNRLLQIACRKRRNYILDQTNVYASAQRRKMRPFEGFQRKAIVIVPTDEEYKTRFDKRTKDEGKEVPEIAVLEMKANFTLPEEGNLFDEVIFCGLDRTEAEKLVEKYREEGRKNGPPPEKRSRGGDGRHHSEGNWGSSRGFRGQPPVPYGGGGGWNRFGGGGFGGGGMGRGGYGRGGFRGRGGGGGFRSGGGGYGNRQGGFGVGGGGRDYGRNDRRDNYNRRDSRGGGGGNRDKAGGWQDRGYGAGRGGPAGANMGYNRQNHGRSSDRGGFRGGNAGGGGVGGYQYQGGKQQSNYKAQQPNSRQGSQQSVAPQSAQAYTYGHHPSQQQNYSQNTNYGSGYTSFQQPNMQQSQASQQAAQAPQQGYQQAYGQPDYSQQWAQYYQQQAQQTQQYQNYYANYQQYYNQSTQQTKQQ